MVKAVSKKGSELTKDELRQINQAKAKEFKAPLMGEKEINDKT